MRSMVEGLHGRTSIGHESNDALQVAQHIPRRNPQRSESLVRKPLVTRFVMTRGIASPMRLATDFEHQPCLEAGEIENEGARRMLAAKFETAGPWPQFAP
jgi:hypothetical protein